MVRHHVKKGGKGKGSTKAEKLKREERRKKEALEDLDRFAGSSEEEAEEEEEEQEEAADTGDEGDSNSSSSDGEGESKTNEKKQKMTKKPSVKNIDTIPDDGEEADASSNEYSSSSDEDEYGAVAVPDPYVDSDSDGKRRSSPKGTVLPGRKSAGRVGMAGAMSRILGISDDRTDTSSIIVSKKKPSVVLSKTVTPLQKLAKEERAKEDTVREKRRSRREVNLTAMHVPLSAATSRPVMGDGGEEGGRAMAKELEMERIHRRVATKGVVALFNTISRHQRERAQQAAESSLGMISSSKKNQQIQSMSKHGFLDMLKNSGSSSTDNNNNNNNNNGTKGGDDKAGSDDVDARKKNSKGGGWNALKDDFMMNSKLKDWDKDLSDDDDDESGADDSGDERGGANDGGGGALNDDWSSGDEGKSNKKRRKVTA